MQEEKNTPASANPDPGSFRDPDNQVFTVGENVYRALSGEAMRHWEALARTTFAQAATDVGSLITAAKADVHTPAARLPDMPWAGVIEHPRLPFISYPYEWPFGMLRQAALLTLSLLENALTEHWILKDSSPYNVQWRGVTPVYIDVASFVPWTEGTPWRGYDQFCALFLYPLMMEAYRNVPYQPWLRSSLEGITAHECWNVLGLLSVFRPGVLKHVGLHVLMQQDQTGTPQSARDEGQIIGFTQAILKANTKSLRSVITSLKANAAPSEWIGYDEERNYNPQDYQAKLDAVNNWLSRRKYALAWDLGCNSGDFSRIAARHAASVVAIDGDAHVINRLYETLQEKGPKNIIPLVMDLANPSPDQGWNGRERQSLARRGRPDVILALAVIHHLTITANIPLEAIVQWLAGFQAELVVEFIDRDDERVQDLLRTKDIPHADYQRENFERLLSRYFKIQKIGSFRTGRRILYACEPLT